MTHPEPLESVEPGPSSADLLGELTGDHLCPIADQRVATSLASLGELLADAQAHRVLLVLDRPAAHAIGAHPELAKRLAPFDARTFDRFTPNPTWQQGAAAARAAHEHRADAIVSFGGGSCNDVAKVAALGARSPDSIAELATGGANDHAEPLPLISIPTTSGTGSEATHFAAIYVSGRKVSVAHPGLRPRGVILDPALHRAMPPELAATTGLDALGQAVESLWAVGSTEASRALASRALRLASAFIVPSVRRADQRACTGMMVASNLAGHAINISKTTASHALSYQLTQRFGIPHGCAVALTLGHLAAANALVNERDCADPRGSSWVRARVGQAAALLGVEAREMPLRMGALLESLGLPPDLMRAGVKRHALRQIAEAVDPVRLGNNPRHLDTDRIQELLERAWHAASPEPDQAP